MKEKKAHPFFDEKFNGNVIVCHYCHNDPNMALKGNTYQGTRRTTGGSLA